MYFFRICFNAAIINHHTEEKKSWKNNFNSTLKKIVFLVLYWNLKTDRVNFNKETINYLFMKTLI